MYTRPVRIWRFSNSEGKHQYLDCSDAAWDMHGPARQVNFSRGRQAFRGDIIISEENITSGCFDPETLTVKWDNGETWKIINTLGGEIVNVPLIISEKGILQGRQYICIYTAENAGNGKDVRLPAISSLALWMAEIFWDN